MSFLNRSRKAAVAGLLGAAGAAGIVVAELDWPAIVGVFVVEAVAVYLTPNAEARSSDG